VAGKEKDNESKLKNGVKDSTNTECNLSTLPKEFDRQRKTTSPSI